MAAASEMQFIASDANLRVREVPIEILYFGEVKRNPGRTRDGPLQMARAGSVGAEHNAKKVVAGLCL